MLNNLRHLIHYRYRTNMENNSKPSFESIYQQNKKYTKCYQEMMRKFHLNNSYKNLHQNQSRFLRDIMYTDSILKKHYTFLLNRKYKTKLLLVSRYLQGMHLNTEMIQLS